MLRAIKIPYFYSLLLILIFATSSFSSAQGWCVESRNENVGSHIALSDCHSDFSTCDDTTFFNVLTTHSPDKPDCTTCYDVRPEILATKLFDDSIESLVSPPPSNTITSPQQYSDLKTFAITSPGDRVVIDQSSTRQTLQNKAIRTVVLLIWYPSLLPESKFFVVVLFDCQHVKEDNFNSCDQSACLFPNHFRCYVIFARLLTDEVHLLIIL